jgi:hypothetical protein
MPDPRQKKGPGRVTPKKGSDAPDAAKADPRARRPIEPKQVGKRPSSPGLLAIVGVMWIVAGVVVFALLTATWKLVPGVVFIGIGLFYIRGAILTMARRGGPEA